MTIWARCQKGTFNMDFYYCYHVLLQTYGDPYKYMLTYGINIFPGRGVTRNCHGQCSRGISRGHWIKEFPGVMVAIAKHCQGQCSGGLVGDKLWKNCQWHLVIDQRNGGESCYDVYLFWIVKIVGVQVCSVRNGLCSKGIREEFMEGRTVVGDD